MTQTLTPYDRYATQYAGAPASGPGWLNSLRKKGFDNFARLGFPTARRGNEAWKYTNVAPVARAEFSVSDAADRPDAGTLSAALPWVDDWNTLVFVNGRFAPELSVIH